MLTNPSFEDGWTDVMAPTWRNQQPAGWELSWLKLGEKLWDSQDAALGVPECVHKLASQLPAEEQIDGPRALILDGTTTYKIFSATAPFGAQLRQVVEGLEPGAEFSLVVPVQVHLHGDPDPWGAEVGVWANGAGGWCSGLRDRTWRLVPVVGQVDTAGRIEVLIRVKSKWPLPKDFFLDALELYVEQEGVPEPEPEPEPTPERPVVWVIAPPGVDVKIRNVE